jgi:hypothetical protein
LSYETFTAVLNASEFPFISDFFQRSVIVPQIDGPPRIPRSLIGDQSNANTELAQQYYCQNIMPTSEGLMSVGYGQIVPPISPSVTDFDQQITLRDSNENNFLFSPANGMNYIFTAARGSWRVTNSIIVPAGTLVTRAYVASRTFICYSKIGIFEYDSATDQLIAVATAGLAIANIDGIFASNNYLLAFDGITVKWSSLVDPLDFVASINTGAGGATPQDVKGTIRAGVPISGGFILYTNKNAVAALYTNNARTPFVFKEVSNAGGIIGPEQVSLDAPLGYHYAWTTFGLQKITAATAEPVSASASDFLSSKLIENFDLTTLTLSTKKLSIYMQVKVSFVSGRYLVLSYGEQSSPQLYTHAVVLDIELKRWGKLRIDHVDAFAYPYPNLAGLIVNPPPKGALAFLQSSGAIQLLIMDMRERQDAGVLLLGKFQLVRNKMMTYQNVELESLHQAYPPQAYLVQSMDGATLLPPKLLRLLEDAGRYKKYGAPFEEGRTSKNFSLLLTGTIELTTATFTTTRHGNR